MKFSAVITLAATAAALPQIRNLDLNEEQDCQTCNQGDCESYDNYVNAALSYVAEDGGSACDGQKCEQCNYDEEEEEITEETSTEESTASKRNIIDENTDENCETCNQGDCESYDNYVNAALSYAAEEEGNTCDGQQCEQCNYDEEEEETTENNLTKRTEEECCGCDCECDCFEDGCCEGFCCDDEEEELLNVGALNAETDEEADEDLKQTVEDVEEDAKETVEDVEEGAEDTVEGVEETTKETAQETAEEASKEVTETADKAENTIGDVIDRIAKRSKKFSDKVPNYFENNKILDVLGANQASETAEEAGVSSKNSQDALLDASKSTLPSKSNKSNKSNKANKAGKTDKTDESDESED